MKPGTDIVFGGYRPGALGAVCALQAEYYAKAWGFGAAFETKVAGDMAAFITRFDPGRDLFVLAEREGEIIGSITVDGGETDRGLAHLRWFIVSDAARGTGLGHRLMDRAVAFAADKELPGIYLDTFAGLDAARHLYEHAGFTMVHSRQDTTWGPPVEEQRFELRF